MTRFVRAAVALVLLATTTACSSDAGTADEQREYVGVGTLDGYRVLARLDRKADGDRLGVVIRDGKDVLCEAVGPAEDTRFLLCDGTTPSARVLALGVPQDAASVTVELGADRLQLQLFPTSAGWPVQLAAGTLPRAQDHPVTGLVVQDADGRLLPPAPAPTA